MEEAEWLEPDDLGGFAMGTASGIRTRRYHALLTVAAAPPSGRVVLVSGIEAWVTGPGGAAVALSTQRYVPNVVHPDTQKTLQSFTHRPWPTWTWRLPDGVTIDQSLFCHRASGDVVLTWTQSGATPLRLAVRPLLAVRPYHALMRANATFSFSTEQVGRHVAWRPYAHEPGVTLLTTGKYVHEPSWYRDFLYVEEQSRGLDAVEDLASPGTVHLTVNPGDNNDAVIVLRAGVAPYGDVNAIAESHRRDERARRAEPDALLRGAEHYLVQREGGLTVIAGYPWFTDWGRDTFIALRGLCLATGRFDRALAILRAWALVVDGGMVPNRFPDVRGGQPEHNAVDASLWFCLVVGELLDVYRVPPADEQLLRSAVAAIVDAYMQGTRYAIQMDTDGLIAAGEPGVQLTWMDAKVDARVITPRIGKPVEIQALWINALRVAEARDRSCAAVRARAEASFRQRFLNPAGGLYDVVDVDHVAGSVDASIRPNQVFAAGGLPHCILDLETARHVVDHVEAHLWTPMGLRSLAPIDHAYRGTYAGGVVERDEAYHQGTVWPWLIGPFVDAWLHAHKPSSSARRKARERFLEPLLVHLDQHGLGHVSELADGDAPHHARGAPFQAWSLGELIRARKNLETSP